MRIVKCIICGKEFQANKRGCICSPECRAERNRQTSRANYGRRSELETKRKNNTALKEKADTIYIKNKEAREKGLTYGQLQALKWIKENRVQL